jgi:hypothetical protein
MPAMPAMPYFSTFQGCLACRAGDLQPSSTSLNTPRRTPALRNTGKPRLNEYEGTKDFVLYSRDFVIAGLIYNKLNIEALEIKFFIAGILFLKGSLYRGCSVFVISK